ncbi:MAG: hypothetical protein HUK19_03255 [Fibrobacter sp.]|nr:hypothetical protein [Fibrobacter sp.]
MKTKIASFLTAAVVSVLTLASSSFAGAESSFYEKDHVRGFVSIGGDYRGMRAEFQNYVNSTAFFEGGFVDPTDTTGALTTPSGISYNSFDSWYIGLHINVGAQYKQFLTWFDFNFMPTQVSEKPSDDVNGHALFDVKWFSYGADWMFGWKLLGENNFINVIPAVGVGMNLINFHMAAEYTVSDASGNQAQLRDRYYSTLASTFNAELEVRLEFDPIAVGVYGGYRFVRYNSLNMEGIEFQNPAYKYDTDNVGDTWFVGLRATWLFRSEWQRKQDVKL